MPFDEPVATHRDTEVIPSRVPRSHAYKLEAIGKTFTQGSVSFTALREVNLSIPSGLFTTVVGPSGSGKSTLLSIIGLLDRPTEGDLTVDGTLVTAFSEADRCMFRATHLGFVFQAFHLMQQRSVLDNVMLGGLYKGKSRKGRRADAVEKLDRVGLSLKSNKPASTLSGGERQRVAIARALVGSPRILLCDEPTGNLDSSTGGDVISILTGLANEGVTVLVVTHDNKLAARGDCRVQVKDGQVRGDL